MRGFEELPVTQPNRQFPVGDVVDENHAAMADDWFDTVSHYPPDRLVSYIEYASRPKDRHGPGGMETHNAALKLIDGWEYYHDGSLNQHITWGYKFARAFMDETRFLPAFTTDLTEQLAEMGTSDRNAKNSIMFHLVAKAEFFGSEAWKGMERSHPSVLTQFKRLIEVARVPFSLNLDEGERYFIVGMMLPYMFSYISEMERYIQENGYTGFESESTGE